MKKEQGKSPKAVKKKEISAKNAQKGVSGKQKKDRLVVEDFDRRDDKAPQKGSKSASEEYGGQMPSKPVTVGSETLEMLDLEEWLPKDAPQQSDRAAKKISSEKKAAREKDRQKKGKKADQEESFLDFMPRKMTKTAAAPVKKTKAEAAAPEKKPKVESAISEKKPKAQPAVSEKKPKAEPAVTGKKPKPEAEKAAPGRKGGSGGKTKQHSSWLKEFNAMDAVIAVTGVVVLLVAVLTVGIYSSARTVEGQVAAMAEVGEKMEAIGIAGDSVFTAVADARTAALEAAQIEVPTQEESRQEEYQEKELTVAVDVGLKLTSVQKDLKIKLTNKSSGKLIGNHAFSVEIKGPESMNKTDEDKDGIIYISSITPGEYTVTVTAPDQIDGSRAAGVSSVVTVKDKIEYKKIDVADEVKSEAEVNTAKEDTEVKAQVESVNTDTVEWTTSTTTPVEGAGDDVSYEEVPKSEIPEPGTVAFLKGVVEPDVPAASQAAVSSAFPAGVYFSQTTVSGETQQETQSLSESAAETQQSSEAPSESQTESLQSSESQTESLQSSESQTEPSQPSESQTESSQTSESQTETQREETQQESQTTEPVETKTEETQTAEDSEVRISLETPGSIRVGEEKQLKAVPEGNYDEGSLEWSVSYDGLLASIDAKSGRVKGLAVGQVVVTVKVKSKDGQKTASATGELNVTVGEEGFRLDPVNATVRVGARQTISVAVNTQEDKAVDWSVSDGEVLRIVESGDDRCVVEAVKAGSATVTAVSRADQDKKAYCEIKAAETDGSAPLKDKDGNQLYYRENGEYKPATAADYYKYAQFFRRKSNGQYRYTGWQNIDGKRYYFDKNGVPVTGEQVIQGMKYVFNADGSLQVNGIMGIDVSKHNGNIDWNAVKNAGVNFVIIRCGYRGSATGVLVEDQRFKSNIQGAAAAGLKVGIYFFSQAVNEIEAVEEASMTIDLIRRYSITYPVYMDVEEANGRADKLDAAARTRVIRAFCETVRASGYTAGVYASKSWLAEEMNAGELSNYKIWLAQYAATPSYGGRYEMWQYSRRGQISGIPEKVDLNISYMSY